MKKRRHKIRRALTFESLTRPAYQFDCRRITTQTIMATGKADGTRAKNDKLQVATNFLHFTVLRRLRECDAIGKCHIVFLGGGEMRPLDSHPQPTVL